MILYNDFTLQTDINLATKSFCIFENTSEAHTMPYCRYTSKQVPERGQKEDAELKVTNLVQSDKKSHAARNQAPVQNFKISTWKRFVDASKVGAFILYT
jgi:hypothetical protein